MPSTDRLLASEWRAALGLSAVFLVRMLGLFMLLPVLALYADKLTAATPFLVGVALGIYGLSQAVLQIPMGRFSDRIGRKPVITLGLLIFAAGGLLAAQSHHIWGVIAGRALQGAGAVSGASLALAADLTRASHRTKVMALIGISIGLSFSLAFVIGPWIDGAFGLAGVFFASAMLGIAAIPLLWVAVPNAPRVVDAQHSKAAPDARAVYGLYAGVFCLHGILAANFVSIPLLLADGINLVSAQHYRIYLPVITASLVFTGPMIMVSHRGQLARSLCRVSIALLLLADLILFAPTPSTGTAFCGLLVFFIGFNFLEASLPSIVSSAVPPAGRGAALGTYATSQFVGMFVGGLCGGAVAGTFDYRSVFLFCAACTLVWLGFAMKASYFIEFAEPPD